MTEITIPFSDPMEDANRQLIKTCTSRSKRYGNPGDTFRSGGYIFKLLDVIEFRLSFICERLYRLEGFDSPEAFEIAWRSYHQGQFPHDELRWTHFYIPIGKVEPASLRLKVKRTEVQFNLKSAAKTGMFELYLNDSLKIRTISLNEIHHMVKDAKMVAETIGLQMIDETDEQLKRRIFGGK